MLKSGEYREVMETLAQLNQLSDEERPVYREKIPLETQAEVNCRAKSRKQLYRFFGM